MNTEEKLGILRTWYREENDLRIRGMIGELGRAWKRQNEPIDKQITDLQERIRSKVKKTTRDVFFETAQQAFLGGE